MAAALAGGALLWAGQAGVCAADTPVKSANDFTAVEYYDPPFEMQIKSRLAGTEAIPQPNGLVLVRQLKLETYETNGHPQFVVLAPECLYDQLHRTASSAGPLEVRQAAGLVRITGQGFSWNQDEEFLTVSNQDVTEIRPGSNIIKLP